MLVILFCIYCKCRHHKNVFSNCKLEECFHKNVYNIDLTVTIVNFCCFIAEHMTHIYKDPGSLLLYRCIIQEDVSDFSIKLQQRPSSYAEDRCWSTLLANSIGLFTIVNLYCFIARQPHCCIDNSHPYT